MYWCCERGGVMVLGILDHDFEGCKRPTQYCSVLSSPAAQQYCHDRSSSITIFQLRRGACSSLRSSSGQDESPRLLHSQNLLWRKPKHLFCRSKHPAAPTLLQIYRKYILEARRKQQQVSEVGMMQSSAVYIEERRRRILFTFENPPPTIKKDTKAWWRYEFEAFIIWI